MSTGAFQAPKNIVTISADMMNTFTYSAKNRKPNRIPEYSVAKPATISESASVRSNGVRLASATPAMKKISAPSGWRKTNQSHTQPDCWRLIESIERVPARRIRPTTESVSGISYETTCAAERRPPRSEYLLNDDQPASSRPTTVMPPTANRYSRPMLSGAPTRPGPNGTTMKVITAVRNTRTGAQVNTRR